MDINQMRIDICKVYDSANWNAKVAHMPDNQVIAIYHKFKSQNFKPKKELPGEISCEQLNMFDTKDGGFNYDSLVNDIGRDGCKPPGR